MSSRARFGLFLLLLLVASALFGYFFEYLARFTPDDQWHDGFWKGYTACWDAPRTLRESAP